MSAWRKMVTVLISVLTHKDHTIVNVTVDTNHLLTNIIVQVCLFY